MRSFDKLFKNRKVHFLTEGFTDFHLLYLVSHYSAYELEEIPFCEHSKAVYEKANRAININSSL